MSWQLSLLLLRLLLLLQLLLLLLLLLQQLLVEGAGLPDAGRKGLIRPELVDTLGFRTSFRTFWNSCSP